jgi:acetyl-CoA carboxylase carboxyl transferase subunit beta
VLFSASGGARMQEGVLSLMQMAKTSAARARCARPGCRTSRCCCTRPPAAWPRRSRCSATSSLAEPDALIGFAGPRVIEQTIRQQLPPGFQRSEFLLEHGMVDQVVPRLELKAALVRALRWFTHTPSPDAGDTVDDSELAAAHRDDDLP